jgi:CTP:molybdopterin cytidylyltransferase MocA
MVGIGAVITAAGKSSRMGAFKPLLRIGTLTVVEQVIQNFHAAGIRDIILVTGNNAEELENSLAHMDLVFLRNEKYEHNEMLDSVKIGLNYLKDTCDRVFLTPVDVPLFAPHTVKALLKNKANIGIPTFKGETGHPIIVDSNAIKKILMFSGDGGLREAMANLSLDVEYIETGDEGILYDIDTQADYEKILRLQSSL